MHTSFKTTTLIAAISMIGYTAYMTTRYIIHEVHPTPYCYALGEDIRTRMAFDILPLSLIVACMALYKHRPTKDASKSFRILTIGLFIALICTPIVFFNHVYIGDMPSLFPPIYWRVLMLVAGIVWLFMLRQQPTEEPSPRSYRVTLILTMLILALPLVMEMISGLSLAIKGDILCLNSWAFKSWTKWIAPILPLVYFVFPSIQHINTTRNSHCTQGSFDERTFQRHRIITLVLVGLTSVTFLASSICFCMLAKLYICHFYSEYARHIYNHIITIGQISICSFALFALLSWIMLSIMAFRQLPNPRGYKIYNITCHIVAWSSLILSCVLIMLDQPIADVCVIISIFTFCAFYITQTIRVIGYSIPRSIDL